MITKSVPTIRYDIYIAGDINVAKQLCREYCFDIGLCVTVEQVSFIYTGGEEIGIRVGLINYPRFPTTGKDLENVTKTLADKLMQGMFQQSYSIVGPESTEWYSRRKV